MSIRFVIHFLKTMSNCELEPIREMLHSLQENVPIVIITINKTESKDLVLFDTNSPDVIPISGTFVQTGEKEYLLCNNTRYSSDTAKIESFPFPVKLKISSTDKQLIKDADTIKELIDHVYQFSRMYWKSVKQQNLPHFESNIIPSFGQNNLWFL